MPTGDSHQNDVNYVGCRDDPEHRKGFSIELELSIFDTLSSMVEGVVVRSPKSRLDKRLIGALWHVSGQRPSVQANVTLSLFDGRECHQRWKS